MSDHLTRKLKNMLLLHNQIKMRETGSAEVIAHVLGIPETEVYYLVQQLMELNPSLRYHPEKATYYYGDGFPDHVAISIAVVRGNDSIQKLLKVTTNEPIIYNFLFT